MSTINVNLQTSTESEDIKEKNCDHIKSTAIDNFLKNLSVIKIKELSNRFKPIEIQGKVPHKKFINLMNEIFGDSYIYQPLYELIFSRFKRVRCSVLSHREKSFMTRIIPEDEISAYDICCALSIFITCEFNEKLRLLFDLTDIDDDGYLNEEEIVRLITTLNYLFCNEEKPIPSESTIINQSLANIRIKENLDLLMHKPGELKKVLVSDLYVDFDTFYEKLTNIPFYKYKIIPCFVNFRDCLNVNKNEVGIVVNKNVKDDFISISNDILSTIKLSPNKNEEIKFKYPSRKFTLKDNIFNEYTNRSKPRNIKKNSLILPTFCIKKNLNNYNNSSTLNTKANSITENASINITAPAEINDKPPQNKVVVPGRTRFSMRNLIFKNMQDKREITCNYEHIHNMEIHPAIIKVMNNSDINVNKVSLINPGYTKKYNYMKRPALYKELLKKHYRYLTTNEVLSEIEMLSNKHKGEEFNVQVLDEVDSEVNQKGLFMRNHLKGKNKYENKIIFGRYTDIKKSIN